MRCEAGQESPFVASVRDAGHHFTGVIPATAGIHFADNSLVERWIPALASRRNSDPAGGRRSFASPRAGMTPRLESVGRGERRRTASEFLPSLFAVSPYPRYGR